MYRIALAGLITLLAACGESERVPPPASVSQAPTGPRGAPEFVAAPTANRAARAPTDSYINYQGYRSPRPSGSP